jgi:hypothetical protein
MAYGPIVAPAEIGGRTQTYNGEDGEVPLKKAIVVAELGTDPPAFRTSNDSSIRIERPTVMGLAGCVFTRT